MTAPADTAAFLRNLADAWDAWANREPDRLRRYRAWCMAIGVREAADLLERGQIRDPMPPVTKP